MGESVELMRHAHALLAKRNGAFEAEDEVELLRQHNAELAQRNVALEVENSLLRGLCFAHAARFQAAEHRLGFLQTLTKFPLGKRPKLLSVLSCADVCSLVCELCGLHASSCLRASAPSARQAVHEVAAALRCRSAVPVYVLGPQLFVWRLQEQCVQLPQAYVEGPGGAPVDGAGILGGQLYVLSKAGLFTRSSPFAEDGCAWTQLSPMPAWDHVGASHFPRCDGPSSRCHGVVGGEIVVIGETGKLEARGKAFRPGVGWRPIAPLHVARGGAGSSVCQDRLLVLGGNTSSGVSADVEAYDGHGWVQLPSLQQRRKQAACATLGDRVFVCGGTDEHGRELRSCEVFTGGTWQSLPPMPVARTNACAVAGFGQLFVFGGRSRQHGAPVADSCVAFDPNTDEWREVPWSMTGTPPAACYGAALIPLVPRWCK